MNGVSGSERGDRAWSWVVKIGSFGVFVYATTFRGSEPSFGIAFLAIAAAVLPTAELRRVLRRWKDGGDSNG
jgi:hypothetical protein